MTRLYAHPYTLAQVVARLRDIETNGFEVVQGATRRGELRGMLEMLAERLRVESVGASLASPPEPPQSVR